MKIFNKPFERIELYQNDRDLKYKKIALLESKIISIQDKISRLNKSKRYDFSYNTLFGRIAKELLPFWPGMHYEVLGPFGLASHTSIWIVDKKEKIKCEKNKTEGLPYIKASVTFNVGNNCLFILDYNKRPKLPDNWTNSIHYLNDFDVPKVDITSWTYEELAKWMKDNHE